ADRVEPAEDLVELPADVAPGKPPRVQLGGPEQRTRLDGRRFVRERLLHRDDLLDGPETRPDRLRELLHPETELAVLELASEAGDADAADGHDRPGGRVALEPPPPHPVELEDVADLGQVDGRVDEVVEG